MSKTAESTKNASSSDRKAFWLEAPRVEAERVAGWTIPSVVLERAKREPEGIAYAVPNMNGGFDPVRWGQIGAAVAETAVGLRELGIEQGDRIAIIGEASIDWILCDYGGLGAGAITVGVYQTSSTHEIAHIIQDSTPRVFVAQRVDQLEKGIDALHAAGPVSSVQYFVLMEGEHRSNEKTRGYQVIELDRLREKGRLALLGAPRRFAEMVSRLKDTDPARIVYTSGTTGKPKGAVYQHNNLLLIGEQWVFRCPPIRLRETRTVAFLSPAHISPALLTQIAPLVSKLTPYFASYGSDLIETFLKIRPQLIAMTPRFYQKIAVQLAIRQNSIAWPLRHLHKMFMRIGARAIKREWGGHPPAPVASAFLSIGRKYLFRSLLAKVGLEEITRAQTGSAATPVEVATLLAIWGIDMREAYGTTETGFSASYQADEFPRPGNIGRPLEPQPGTELKLSDEGEMLVRSPMMFRGYWNNPRATELAFENGWYKTGDIAEWTQYGELRLVGRKNDAISTAGGKTVNLAEIENELKLSPYISEAIAVGHGEKFLTALFEIEFEAVANWARTHGHGFTSYGDVAQSPDVVRLLEKEVETANARLGRAQQIKKFRIIPESLEQAPGALTASRKVRRQVVHDRYRELIESMYDRSERDLLTSHSGSLTSSS